MKSIITGLDIGTSKICAAIAGTTPSGIAKVAGIGIAESRGINKGFVSNLDKLVDAISKAIHVAEDNAGVRAHHVVANISGAAVTAKTNEGLIPLSRRGREITRRDIRRVIEITKNISLTMEKDFLYCCPLEFTIDDSHEVENPLGLFGTKLKVSLYVITALATHIQNISKAVNYAGYELLDVVPTSVAAQSGMLEDDESNEGSVFIDMGGGITEIAIFYGDTLKFLDSVNVGGMDLTARLSANLKVPFGNAEMIKRRYGSIAKEDLKKDQNNIFDIDNRHVTVNSDVMNNMLKERFEEIFHVLHDRLKSSDYFKLPIHNAVVTGGCSLLHGALESMEKLLNIHVRMGRPVAIDGESSFLTNPTYAAAISLAKHGLNTYTKPRSKTQMKDRFFILDTYHKFRELIEDYF